MNTEFRTAKKKNFLNGVGIKLYCQKIAKAKHRMPDFENMRISM